MSIAVSTQNNAGAPRDADVARDAFVEGFRKLSEGPLKSLAGLRRAAIERFAQAGFPTVKNEDWKYTSVGPIVKARFEPSAQQAASVELPQLPFAELAGPRLVFVNGVYSASHSSVSNAKGVRIEPLSQALAKEPEVVGALIEADPSLLTQPFSALNTALFQEGALVRLERGAQLAEPLRIVHVVTGTSRALDVHPRLIVQVGEGASVSVLETYIGSHVLGDENAQPTLTNAVTQFALAQGAIAEHTLVQLQGPRAFHVGRLSVQQARDSRFKSNFVSVGGALVRNEIQATLAGTGAEAELNGLYLARDRQHVDSHTLIDHAVPHCASRENYKGILDGSARAAFTGKVLVRQDAQKTAAEQSNKNLLLSDTATAQTRPQLQIYADDVKCSHGATVGKIDENQVFYLRSRGIPRAQAKRMLTEAFGHELLEQVGNEGLRERLYGVLSQWMGGIA